MVNGSLFASVEIYSVDFGGKKYVHYKYINYIVKYINSEKSKK